MGCWQLAAALALILTLELSSPPPPQGYTLMVDAQLSRLQSALTACTKAFPDTLRPLAPAADEGGGNPASHPGGGAASQPGRNSGLGAGPSSPLSRPATQLPGSSPRTPRGGGGGGSRSRSAGASSAIRQAPSPGLTYGAGGQQPQSMVSELLALLGPLAAPEPGVLPGLEAVLLGDPRIAAAAVVVGTATMQSPGSGSRSPGSRSPGTSSPAGHPIGSPQRLPVAGGSKGSPLDSM